MFDSIELEVPNFIDLNRWLAFQIHYFFNVVQLSPVEKLPGVHGLL